MHIENFHRTDSISSRLLSIENKLAGLNTKVDSLAVKQDVLEQKLNGSEKKIDSELKLLAGVHVKLDLLPNAKKNNTTIASTVEIPLKLPCESEEDVKKLMLTLKNDMDTTEALVIFNFFLLSYLQKTQNNTKSHQQLSSLFVHLYFFYVH